MGCEGIGSEYELKTMFLGAMGTSFSLVLTLLLQNVSFSHNTLRHSHRQTDGDRQTDDCIIPIASVVVLGLGPWP